MLLCALDLEYARSDRLCAVNSSLAGGIFRCLSTMRELFSLLPSVGFLEEMMIMMKLCVRLSKIPLR